MEKLNPAVGWSPEVLNMYRSSHQQLNSPRKEDCNVSSQASSHESAGELPMSMNYTHT